jgi:hypothetical protein
VHPSRSCRMTHLLHPTRTQTNYLVAHPKSGALKTSRTRWQKGKCTRLVENCVVHRVDSDAAGSSTFHSGARQA